MNFRKMMIEMPDYINKNKLTETQVRIVRYINDIGSFSTTREIADRHNLSIQRASNLLSLLHKKKYLTRKQVKDPTGGYIFIYSVHPEVKS